VRFVINRIVHAALENARHSCSASSGKSPARFHHRATCKIAKLAKNILAKNILAKNILAKNIGAAHQALGAVTGQKSHH
jgi:S-adenosylmethionine synthetase